MIIPAMTVQEAKIAAKKPLYDLSSAYRRLAALRLETPGYEADAKSCIDDAIKWQREADQL